VKNKVVVYVIAKKGERTFWTKVGTGTRNADGSIDAKLDSLPIEGKLHIRDLVEGPNE
jgi:hypothetical protein